MAQSTTLAEHFAALATADPEAPAITCAGASVSRRQLEQRTNRLARAYQQLGVTPDSFVTIGLPNTVQFLEAAIVPRGRHRRVEMRSDAAAGVLPAACP